MIYWTLQSLREFGSQRPQTQSGRFAVQRKVHIRPIIENARPGQGSEDNDLLTGDQLGQLSTESFAGFRIDLQASLTACLISLLQ
jgi:hypothetical protein